MAEQQDNLSDDDLVTAAKAGSQTALESLIRRHKGAGGRPHRRRQSHSSLCGEIKWETLIIHGIETIILPDGSTASTWHVETVTRPWSA